MGVERPPPAPQSWGGRGPGPRGCLSEQAGTMPAPSPTDVGNRGGISRPPPPTPQAVAAYRAQLMPEPGSTSVYSPIFCTLPAMRRPFGALRST